MKADLDRDVRLGIIEKVPQGEITEWCSRMVVTPKSNGKPRRTIDFQELNKATLREIHHTQSPINLVSQVPAGKLKTVLDAWNGYHSLLLDPESRKYTNFITEWGMYRYCRGPQGYHGTGDAYTRRFDDITRNEVRYFRCVDDGLLYDDDIESAFWHTFHHIKLCADHGIVFNPDKFRFARECVEFAGFEVTMDGYRPANHLIAAVRDFPTPSDKVDIRSWFGLVNQVAYTFSESGVMEPFRELMKKNVPFYWDERLDRLFQVSKDEIIRQSMEGVKAYDLQKPTCLATDWCKTGMGFALMQKHCQCPGVPDPNCGAGHWKLVTAGSKTTNESQQRYSPTEGECLAAVYGLKRCRMYTLGCPNLTLATDHNPLTGILNDRRLDTIENSRLLELKGKTLPFHFRIVHVPGGSHAMRAADALSRHPVDTDDDTTADEVEKAVCALVASLPPCAESLSWKRVNDAAGMDPECVSLVQLIANGFPKDKKDLPDNLKVYWGMRDDLYVVENVPHKNRKMLIPRDLRSTALEGLHAGHQGVTSMLSNARTRFFWPGLDASIRQLRAQCQQCNEEAPSQSEEPLLLTPPPEMPFEQTASDLFSLEGHTFLAYADRFSGWVEVERLKSNAFPHVREVFLRWFRTFGVPTEIATDGGPPFNAYDYKSFLRTWDVNPRLSSAYYPQSNGRAEAAVKSAKRILLGNINPRTGALDTDAAARALMCHRNTPAQDTGISPSMMLYGRSLRDHLPRSNLEFRPEWEVIKDARELALAKRVLKPAASQKRELESLCPGDSVQIQNQAGNHPKKWSNTGVVARALPNRQYEVIVDGSRRTTLRNRRFLKHISPVQQRASNFIPDTEVNKELVELGTGRTSESINTVQPPSSPTEGIPLIGPDVHEILTLDPQPIEAPLRRSTRTRTQRKVFEAKLHGKTHE